MNIRPISSFIGFKALSFKKLDVDEKSIMSNPTFTEQEKDKFVKAADMAKPNLTDGELQGLLYAEDDKLNLRVYRPYGDKVKNVDITHLRWDNHSLESASKHMENVIKRAVYNDDFDDDIDHIPDLDNDFDDIWDADDYDYGGHWDLTDAYIP